MDLPTLIARVESGNNQWALRFEPSVYKRGKPQSVIDVIRKANKCSDSTAQMIYSTSWGAYQIMGFNLYARLGYAGPIGVYLATPNDQRATFEQFCRADGIWIDGHVNLEADKLLLKFATLYNGPGNPLAYVARMREEGLR